MCYLKDVLLIFLGALLAYIFDLLKREFDKRKTEKDEKIKQCNELTSLCNSLDYYTALCFVKFIEFHYYQQLHYRTNDYSMTSLMFMNKNSYDRITEKIAELNIRIEYCFDEIQRLKKTDFGSDETFLREYKLVHNEKMFNEVSNEELKNKYNEAIGEIEMIMNRDYKPVLNRIKERIKKLKNE